MAEGVRHDRGCAAWQRACGMTEGVRHDGTETDFSYINAVKGKPKAFHHDQAVLRTPPITKPQAFSLRVFLLPDRADESSAWIAASGDKGDAAVAFRR